MVTSHRIIFFLMGNGEHLLVVMDYGRLRNTLALVNSIQISQHGVHLKCFQRKFCLFLISRNQMMYFRLELSCGNFIQVEFLSKTSTLTKLEI